MNPALVSSFELLKIVFFISNDFIISYPLFVCNGMILMASTRADAIPIPIPIPNINGYGSWHQTPCKIMSYISLGLFKACR